MFLNLIIDFFLIYDLLIWVKDGYDIWMYGGILFCCLGFLDFRMVDFIFDGLLVGCFGKFLGKYLE